MKTKLLVLLTISIFTLPVYSQSVSDYFNSGISELKSGNAKEAIQYLDTVIHLDHHNIDAYSIRGFIKGQLEDYKGAIQDLNEAIKIDPNNSTAYDNRGICKKNLGDYQGALADYNTSIVLNPENEKAFHNRAVVKYYFLTDTVGACSDWTSAKKLGYKKAYEFSKGKCPDEKDKLISFSSSDEQISERAISYKSMAMLESEFYNFLKKNNISFRMPDNFTNTEVMSNANMPYHYAIKRKDTDFEVRYFIESIPEISEKLKGISDKDPNKLYESTFISSIMNISQTEPEYEYYKPNNVKNEFAGDDGLYSAFYPNSEYGKNFDFALLMVIHKKDKANFYVTFLGNDSDKFNEYMISTFHAMKFIENNL